MNAPTTAAGRALLGRSNLQTHGCYIAPLLPGAIVKIEDEARDGLRAAVLGELSAEVAALIDTQEAVDPDWYVALAEVLAAINRKMAVR